MAFHIPVVDELKDFVDGLAQCHEIGDVEAPFACGLQALVMGLVTIFQPFHHHVVAIIVEPAMRHFLAVLQLKCSCGSIAWVGKEVVASLGTGFVESVEALERHHDFAAHLEKLRIVSVEFKWHGADGFDICCNVVALGAVATGHGTDEHTFFILQADAQSVKLQFAAKLHLFVNGLLDAADEVCNLFAAIGIGQREHGITMLDALKLFGDAASHALGRRSRGEVFRKRFFQPRQLLEFHVELVVADGRLGEDVIIIVVLLQFFAQSSNALTGFFFGHNLM